MSNSLFVIPGDTLTVPDGNYDYYFMAETYGLCEHYQYHKHKIILFLASMRRFRNSIRDMGGTVVYDDLGSSKQSYETKLRKAIRSRDVSSVVTYETKDRFFDAVASACKAEGVDLSYVENPNFLTSKAALAEYFAENDAYHASFYQWQRRRLDVLVEDGGPVGGKWSFDAENRESLDDPSIVPSLPDVEDNEVVEGVKDEVRNRFASHPGRVDGFWLPTSREEAESWLDTFLSERLEHFGTYQDAINKGVPFGFHSVISPMMNLGLLNPRDVVDATLSYYEDSEVRLASVEGFLRQVIGWREFVRGVYESYSLRTNEFGHQRSLQDSWWEGTTGLPPVDDVVDQVMEYGYAHHIQRLMVASNVMLLCEVDPDEVYEWFMSLFVDSADWVMEPNVYDMGQYATGGVFATKPYISSSNYVRKMSDYSEGEWSEDWDALYWSFLDRHRDALADNNRMSFMYSLLDKKSDEDVEEMHERAEAVRDRLTD